jgi:NAD(P)-dependent dehydrogenase (short-subunit alcohol dehydrogenase family)
MRLRQKSTTPVARHLPLLQIWRASATSTAAEYGAIDIIVNNAANPYRSGVGELTLEAWDRSFNINLRGPVFLVQAALPQLRASSHASVINMLSGGAFGAAPSHLLYCVSKAGLAAATRSMAEDLASDGVRVNSLVPGLTNTEMVRAMPEEFHKLTAAASLLRRAAEPSELIGLALLLASDAGGYMTGQTYFCDGGMVPR